MNGDNPTDKLGESSDFLHQPFAPFAFALYLSLSISVARNYDDGGGEQTTLGSTRTI